MNGRTQLQAQPLTLAEICEAIASGRIPAKIEDGYYKVTHRELRLLRQDPEARPPRELPHPAGLAS